MTAHNLTLLGIIKVINKRSIILFFWSMKKKDYFRTYSSIRMLISYLIRFIKKSLPNTKWMNTVLCKIKMNSMITMVFFLIQYRFTNQILTSDSIFMWQISCDKKTKNIGDILSWFTFIITMIRDNDENIFKVQMSENNETLIACDST